MKAARLFAPGNIRLVDAPRPVPGPGEALVRVIAYAPYGTDVSTYLNKGGRYVASYPVGIGADFSGVVEETGDGVHSVRPGQRVSALALDHCGTCAHCIDGRTNLCLDPAYRTLTRQTCCEEYVLVPERKLAVLPGAVGFEDAAMLAGPVDALNAFRKLGLDAGDTVAIVGVGAMGLGALAMARALDITAIAIGGTGKRGELARKVGAEEVFGLSAHGEDVSQAVLERHPAGFAAVMETTASDWGTALAFAVAGLGGRIALTGGGPLGVSNWDIVDRELTIFGVRAGSGQAEVLDLIARKRLSLGETVSRRFAIDQVADAFALLAGPDARDIGRVIIRIGDEA
ncbi:alcohol dehydrogenase catalytic domain-containing protein [Novosphingobium sp. KCTC 2891]|uniref:zinc-dependent alcohol dehydrogenase n=1 Tax=Novosphingobium sp. KCTC 2891 TaxID=2989730 RepID=UPI0022231EDC|nr:alcohol dehydrogenase catalytic domain-containing protein [Novosphingobium sp. KCTC 2891]MCW1383817.1 alcohol dehydrogenase catalytic domain-containing protein [Novosphingobium sp. KCTC 2891]